MFETRHYTFGDSRPLHPHPPVRRTATPPAWIAKAQRLLPLSTWSLSEKLTKARQLQGEAVAAASSRNRALKAKLATQRAVLDASIRDDIRKR